MLHIGLTGGIGSGKSSVSALFERRGARCIDSDGISRQLTAPGGAAIAALRERFGDACIDAHGALDRSWMRARAFANADVRRALEAILHPMVASETSRLLDGAAGAPCVVFDVPLLVETGRWRPRVDRVLVVDCAEQLQVERVMRRSGWAQAAVLEVIAAQASRAERRAAADAVIDNSRDALSALDAEVAALWRLWMPDAPAGPAPADG